MLCCEAKKVEDMAAAKTAAAAADVNAAAAALLVNKRADALTSLHRAAAFVYIFCLYFGLRVDVAFRGGRAFGVVQNVQRCYCCQHPPQ